MITLNGLLKLTVMLLVTLVLWGCQPTQQDILEVHENLVNPDVELEFAATELDEFVALSMATNGYEETLALIEASLVQIIENPETFEIWQQRSRALAGRTYDPELALESALSEQSEKILGFKGNNANKQQTGICPGNAGTTIIYVNGIATSNEEYKLTVELLRTIMKQNFNNVHVIGHYNVSAQEICPTWQSRTIFNIREFLADTCQNAGFSVDFYEAFFQFSISTLEDLARFRQVNPDIVAYAGYGSQGLDYFLNSGSLKTKIVNEVTSGRNVVVVAHSQGNFFARHIKDILGSDSFGSYKNSVGIVALGSPDTGFTTNRERVDVCYDPVTFVSFEPEILGCVRGTGLGLNPVNYHSVTEAYLSDNGAKTQVINAVSSFLPSGSNELSNPRVPLQTGVLQATLTWEHLSDFDLHTIEPDGTRVFWSNEVGTYGELDRDNVIGYGPENYFICNNSWLGIGSYEFGVHLYSGTPGPYKLVVKAGANTKAYEGYLTKDHWLEGTLPIVKVHWDGVIFRFLD